jgi:hypothetical protein
VLRCRTNESQPLSITLESDTLPVTIEPDDRGYLYELPAQELRNGTHFLGCVCVNDSCLPTSAGNPDAAEGRGH